MLPWQPPAGKCRLIGLSLRRPHAVPENAPAPGRASVAPAAFRALQWGIAVLFQATFLPSVQITSEAKRDAFSLLGFTVSLVGLTIQSCVAIQSAGGMSLIEIVFKFLSYFTILTNLLLLGSYGIVLLAPRSRLGRICLSPRFATGLLLYISLVSSLYALLLSRSWNPTGLQAWANVILHYITGPLYLVFWLLFVPKARLPWGVVLLWLAYPVLYFAWVLVHGLIYHDYPYFFMNPSKLGYGGTFAWSGILSGVFLICGLAMIAANRWWHRRVTKTPSVQES